MLTKDTFIFALISAGLIYIMLEIIKKLINKHKVSSETIEEMKINKLSYEDAKKSVLIKKIAKIMKIEKETITLENTREIKQGDRVSFDTHKYGFVTGDFIGTKTAMADGYSQIIIVRINESKILQAPLENIMQDTINIYGRQ